MDNKKFWYYPVLTALFVILGIAWANAQTSFYSDDPFNFETDTMSGFSEDGRVKILLLTLVPSGMTESASEEILKSLYQNLYNTNHFTLVGPSEWGAQIQARNPSLAECSHIACGIEIGKRLGADQVLVGKITVQTILDIMAEEVEGMVLSIRMVDVVTNITTFSDEIQFTDSDMNDTLFKLAVRISEHTPLHGHVLEVKRQEVKIDLGRAHGLKIGNQFVIFSRSKPTTDLEGQTIGVTQQNIALAQIHRLNDNTAYAIVQQQLEDIEAGQFIQTYVNFSKQIELVAQTRREMDTQKRLRPRIRPLGIVPKVVDDGKDKWLARLMMAEKEEKRWQYISIGTGIISFILFNNTFEPLGGDLKGINPWLPHITGGVAVFGVYKFIQARKLVNEIQAEGRVKKYISSLDYQLDLRPTSVQVSLQYKF